MRARGVVPIVAGIGSVALGPHTNWDLYNYHLYNPFALLNGRLAVDGRRDAGDNRSVAEEAAAACAEHGFALDVGSCAPFTAYGGRRHRALQRCALALR